MRQRKWFAAMSLLACAYGARAAEVDAKPVTPVVQIAILLDTSNSMDGLINQARAQLWKVVNECNRCKCEGVAPKLQVALYEYGNNNLAAGEGYVRMVLPMTTDLDLVSEKLWSLKTNGGSEYCGQVIHNAVEDLAWSHQKGAYRAIFIAGNEPFSQGNLDFHVACAEALAKGVIVNTIHCGPEGVGRESGWAEGAKIGEGKFLNIDQDRACASIVAPQDEEIMRLSKELNGTYIPYGKYGFSGKARQSAQDEAAATNGAGNAAERGVAKAGRSYENSSWDMVDALKEKKIDIAGVTEASLPPEMQKMSPDERKQYVEKQAARRDELQTKINELNDARSRFVSEEEKKQSASGTDTFSDAVLKAVREQMAEKNFKFE